MGEEIEYQEVTPCAIRSQDNKFDQMDTSQANSEAEVPRKVGKFGAIYETEDGEFRCLPDLVTVLRFSNGRQILAEEDREESRRLFHQYLVEIGAIRHDEDIGNPLIGGGSSTTVEYFKVTVRKNQGGGAGQ